VEAVVEIHKVSAGQRWFRNSARVTRLPES
jgi:hypothetical protein